MLASVVPIQICKIFNSNLSSVWVFKIGSTSLCLKEFFSFSYTICIFLVFYQGSQIPNKITQTDIMDAKAVHILLLHTKNTATLGKGLEKDIQKMNLGKKLV